MFQTLSSKVKQPPGFFPMRSDRAVLEIWRYDTSPSPHFLGPMCTGGKTQGKSLGFQQRKERMSSLDSERFIAGHLTCDNNNALCVTCIHLHNNTKGSLSCVILHKKKLRPRDWIICPKSLRFQEAEQSSMKVHLSSKPWAPNLCCPHPPPNLKSAPRFFFTAITASLKQMCSTGKPKILK